MEPDTMAFDGPCPFGTCLKREPHTHPICPSCGAVRYGNPTCPECRKQKEPGGLRFLEMEEYLKTLDGTP